MGHVVSVAVVQHCPCSVKAVIDNMFTNENGHIPKEFYKYTWQAGFGLWARGGQLLTWNVRCCLFHSEVEIDL